MDIYLVKIHYFFLTELMLNFNHFRKFVILYQLPRQSCSLDGRSMTNGNALARWNFRKARHLENNLLAFHKNV